MTGLIRVLLVDDHAVVRQGLRSFLELQPDIQVVGETGDGVSAARLAAETAADVVLMDLVMPEGDGLDGIRSVRLARPEARVVVLSSFLDDTRVFAAVQAGAAGYLLKDIEPEALAESIRQVHQGLPALHPEAAAHLLQRTAQRGAGDGLTRRELDVLRLLSEGLANKEIAQRLFVSQKTVKTHVSHIFQKLGVSDRTQAALLAVRRKLVE